MNKPFDTYFGGKESSGVYQTIINCIPEHDLFIEPFGGNFTISRKMHDKALKLVNDISKKTFQKYPRPNYLRNYMFTNLDWKVLCDQVFVHQGPVYARFRKVLYLDPPYPLSSRKSAKLVYEHEMTDQQHEELLDYARAIPFGTDVLISTYPNELYKSKLADWYHIEFEGKDRHGKTTEWLFMNFDPKGITKLHDISYYGSDFTDRQRFKRTMANTIRKIDELDPIAKNYFVGQLLEKQSAAQFNAAMYPGKRDVEYYYYQKLSGYGAVQTQPKKIQFIKTKPDGSDM